MAKTNKKTREIIKPNDIIPESRNKINENFNNRHGRVYWLIFG